MLNHSRMGRTCVLRRRNRYAPEAIINPTELYEAEYVYLVDLGHIFECKVERLDGDPTNPNTRAVLESREALGAFDLPLYQLGILPYPKEYIDGDHDSDSRPKYDGWMMMFRDPHKAAHAAMHPEYRFKRSTAAVARDMKKCLNAFSGLRNLPLRENPNITG